MTENGKEERSELSQRAITVTIDKSKMGYAALISGVIMAFSVFLPWGSFLGMVEASAFDAYGVGCLVILIAGIIAAGLSLVHISVEGKGRVHIVAGLCGLGLMGYSLWDIMRVQDAHISPDYGLFLCGLAGIVLIAIGIMEVRRAKTLTPDAETAGFDMAIAERKEFYDKTAASKLEATATITEEPKIKPVTVHQTTPAMQPPQQFEVSHIDIDEGKKKLREALAQLAGVQNYLSGLERLRDDKSITKETYQSMKSEYTKRMTDIETQTAEMKLQLNGHLELLKNDVRYYTQELEKLTVRHKLGELPEGEYINKYNDVHARLVSATQEVEAITSLIQGRAGLVEASDAKASLVHEKEYSEVSLPEPAPEPESLQIDASMPRAPWNTGRLLMGAGILICVLGTIVAVLIPPCKVGGASVGYHFIFQYAGHGLRAYNLINVGTFILELVIINIVGIALTYVGFRMRPG